MSVRAGEKWRHFSRSWPVPAVPKVRQPIGEDAVRTLQQTLHLFERFDFLKVGLETSPG
jgi:hypothetical protein